MPSLRAATAAHTMEVDDIYCDAINHPGAPTIAAALALAQESGASGEAFLRGVIVGYEVSTRIGAAMGRAHYRCWHNTGTIGSFGAAAAAAAIYGLDAKRFAHTLATVTTFAAGLQQAFRMDSISKPLHAGRAAEAGLLAALASFEPARMGDSATRELMRRIDLSVDAEIDATFPGQRAARIAIETKDGRRAHAS